MSNTSAGQFEGRLRGNWDTWDSLGGEDTSHISLIISLKRLRVNGKIFGGYGDYGSYGSYYDKWHPKDFVIFFKSGRVGGCSSGEHRGSLITAPMQ